MPVHYKSDINYSGADICIIKGFSMKKMKKEELLSIMFDIAIENSDAIFPTELDRLVDDYIYYDALDWLITNIFRTAWIQLYSDKEIRLNFDRLYIILTHDEGKCVFLSEARISDMKLNELLYSTLETLVEPENG